MRSADVIINPVKLECTAYHPLLEPQGAPLKGTVEVVAGAVESGIALTVIESPVSRQI
jgi:hypothetical protein